MLKRGQVTVFIIIGILVFLIVSGILIARSFLVTEELKGEGEQAQLLGATVQSYIQSCLKETAEDALIFVGQQGGYYQLPSLHESDLLQPFYWYENQSYLPKKEEIEQQLSLYVDNELFFCLRNFVVFENQGYEIQEKEVQTTTKLGKEETVFTMSFPVEITQGKASRTIATFSVEIPSRLETIYNAIEKLIEEGQQNPTAVCISCIARMISENELKVETIPFDDKVAFTVIDEKILIDSQPYEFRFVHKYQFEEAVLK